MNGKRLVRWTAVAVSLLIVVGYSAVPRYDRSHYSPRHVYRLDYYEASWLQRLMHWDMKYPHVIRLYRTQPETLLGESDVVDLWLNGDINWWFDPPLNVVRVGQDVVFENIPPECVDCPRLPDSVLMP
jgi:hypothetical protein